jgi:sec-independent protein translocase protein TatB
VFGVSPAELLTIAIVILVVFGPERLPELSRKAGRALRELKDAADDLRRGIEAEAGVTESDLGTVRRAMPPTLDAEDPPQPPAAPAEGSGGAG